MSSCGFFSPLWQSLWRQSADNPLIQLTENRSNLIQAVILWAHILTSWLPEEVEEHGCVWFTYTCRTSPVSPLSFGFPQVYLSISKPEKGPLGGTFFVKWSHGAVTDTEGMLLLTHLIRQQSSPQTKTQYLVFSHLEKLELTFSPKTQSFFSFLSRSYSWSPPPLFPYTLELDFKTKLLKGQ